MTKKDAVQLCWRRLGDEATRFVEPVQYLLQTLSFLFLLAFDLD